MTEECGSTADVRLSEQLGRTAERAGTVFGFTVEARTKSGPTVVNGQAFDGQWRQVSFDETPRDVGVRPRLVSDYELAAFGLMRFEAAQAMRWWWLAAQTFGMETRLRKYRVEYKMQQYDEGGAHELGDWADRVRSCAA